MSYKKIKIVQELPFAPASSKDEFEITFNELRHWVLSGSLVKHLFRYREARLVTYRRAVIIKPLLTALVLKLLSHGKCSIEDNSGKRFSITTRALAKFLLQFAKDFFQKTKKLRLIHAEIDSLSQEKILSKSSRNLFLSNTPVYLRTDLWFGIPSGGSVGHIAGVLNNLDLYCGKPVFLTTDFIPTVRNDIETYTVYPDGSFWDFAELPGLFFNESFENNALKILQKKKLSFIYQRYSFNNYAGLKLARFFHVPFVLEYNGSEIWVSRHWGKRLKYEELSERIEMLNLKAAQLIVVISSPLKDELLLRGIDAEKILVNPNGVDPDRYSPEKDGSRIRRQYDLNGKTVIGFIGTFGKWHGAEVLAEAFGRLLKKYPEYRDTVRLLMIGDGVTMTLVKEALEKYAVGDACILTGRIPQEDGPTHLAACHILASPHVPNPDGTPFFGSPTKLFEYMAMGKGIVASDLDQIGEILKHENTAWMVKPGDADSLMHGLKMLIDHPELRQRLGKAAREEVVAHYTWKEHTRKIIEKLKHVTGSA